MTCAPLATQDLEKQLRDALAAHKAAQDSIDALERSSDNRIAAATEAGERVGRAAVQAHVDEQLAHERAEHQKALAAAQAAFKVELDAGASGCVCVCVGAW